jgi:ABC-type lipoprotein export system ATPase subunit
MWRIWDLHVHTPASIVQGYGGDNDETWSRFLTELESLPKDIAVVGINDYWFLDGYRRVVAARNSGRLQNLDAVFPVVEMRLDQFGGTAGDLSRVNLHAVFDPELDPEIIQAQFLNALQSEAKLSPEHESLQWSGVITRDSLADLGRKIKESVPEDQRNKYGSDLLEGFNNLNVSLSKVKNVLARDYFKGKALLGVGKTEWADIKWNDQSIAAKKTVINSADFVFTAFEDTSRWTSDVEKLRSSNVTYHLLDCSDAHHFSDSREHMRLGACQTWMNTTPTLAGLAYALEEFDRRVYVGLEPPPLSRIRKHPELFASKIRVTSDDADHLLFDYEIPLNSGFVAVVGNKGQGKSALLDCIALAGNSARDREFAFLTPARFLRPTNAKTAGEYYAELEWETGSVRRSQLPDGHQRSAPVSVEYLPQAFVERVCNVDPAEGEADEFEDELRTVLFTHIGEEDRLGEATFDGLLAQKTRGSRAGVDRLREELRASVESYATIASFRASNVLSEVDARIALKEAETSSAEDALRAAEATLAAIDSSSQDDGNLTDLKNRAEQVEAARLELAGNLTLNERRQARARHALTEMEALLLRAQDLETDAAALAAQAVQLLGSEDDTPFVSVTVNRLGYDSWSADVKAELAISQTEHAALLVENATLDDARRQSTEALAAADSARERARQHVLQSQERHAALIGDEKDAQSLSGLLALRMRILEVPVEMDMLRQQILEHTGHIHAALSTQLEAVESLYAPASDFIAQSAVLKNAGLEFAAELRILPTWHSVPIGLDGRRNGEFPNWLTELPQRTEDTSWEQLSSHLEEAILRLEHERGEAEGTYRDPASALRSTTTLDEFLMKLLDLSWLEVRFGLTGDGLPLTQLSPGQRGLVLALFYLVVDRRTTPLLLDQPEENLDNETIASKLVPAIHEAAGRRQTIVVTHNANLAVVGDADQIIHCRFQDQRFTVSSGSIAELDVAQFALNVLEGTKLAFDNRRHKYEAFPQLS